MDERIVQFQPSIPTVYAEPVEGYVDFEDYEFERDTDELLRFVNGHAERVSAEEREARIAKRRRIIAALNVALVSTVTFFTAVGITTVFHWIFG